MWKKRTVLTVAVSLALPLAACGSEGGAGGSDDDSGSEPQADGVCSTADASAPIRPMRA